MVISTFMGCSSIVADITNSEKRPDSWQRATAVYRLLVVIVTGKLYFKAY
jgi:hypothetical protein